MADAKKGQVFVAVSHSDDSTNLYVSEHKGESKELSLERVLFTNKASFDRISWLVYVFIDTTFYVNYGTNSNTIIIGSNCYNFGNFSCCICYTSTST